FAATTLHVPSEKPHFKMRHIAAYLLAAMGTNQPTAATIKSILGSVGSALISSMPSCGGGVSSSIDAVAPAAAPAAEVKEEKKEEPEEESDDDMGFGLFD
ncbi:60S acidic ribosomal protein P2-like 2, partial [Homarus americanus]